MRSSRSCTEPVDRKPPQGRPQKKNRGGAAMLVAYLAKYSNWVAYFKEPSVYIYIYIYRIYNEIASAPLGLGALATSLF